jgi:ATP-dependent RNA helicase SUPV3L1/SUV3
MTSYSTAGSRAPGAGVTAVLGPTTTGKTFLAIERMLALSSGAIGLPLRLLAREVYNKVAARAGTEAVALITGEEKIKPRAPRYWVSTVEAMPRDLDVAFLAIDEVQLAADLERGHVFTDRALHYRGREETLLLGAATMRPLIEKLLPGVSIVTRPRLSQLTFAGERKITRQPRRTALVAFSADEVYAIAELIRRRHGGAAVVMGSLSPRTRNAQVELFQSGDVDYLVATDAIGMGLNLDVDHVAFASDRKFDGYQFRRLTPAEFAQIAGRAGRAARDGTFGTTGRCEPFEPELVNALQNHAFDSVKILQWRNSALDFSSLGALEASLAQPPGREGLTSAPPADDVRVLAHAVRDETVRQQAQGAVAVQRLWDACQIPDYRKISPAAHAELVTTLYDFLMRKGHIPDDWFAAQIAQADRTDGGIDTLSARIAQVRTWTFVANRPDWLADPAHWQDVSRAVEDKLSDALHERLTERFVDRRTSVLMRRLRENVMLNTEIGKTGEVVVEGHTIGRLDGFMFAPEAAEAGSDAKALQAAAQKALAGEIDARAERLAAAPDDQFVLASDGVLRWTGDAVGRLMASDAALTPRVRILADERLTGAPRDAVQARLDLWLATHVGKLLGPLMDLSKAEDVTGIARGIAFQLVEALGVLERQKIAAEIKDLDQPSRASLRKYGVRFGAYHIYIPTLLKPGARALASLLWAIRHDDIDPSALAGAQHFAAAGRTSFAAEPALNRDAYRVLGYRLAGDRAVRVDILERLADLIRPALAWREGTSGEKPAGAFDGRGFVVTQAMTSLAGSAGESFASILKSLGYRMELRPPLPEPPAAAPEVSAAPEAAAADGTAPAEATGQAVEPASASAQTESSQTESSPEAASADIAPVDAAAADHLASDVAADVQPVSMEAVAVVAEDAQAPQPAAGIVEAAADIASADSVEVATPDATAAVAEDTSADAPAETAVPAERGEAGVADAAPAAAVEAAKDAPPAMVEVWRPAGHSHDRPRHDRNARPRGARPQGGGEEGAEPRRSRRPDRRNKPRGEAEAGSTAPAGGEERPPRQRFAGKGKPKFRGGAKEFGGGRERAERDRPIDPNSPFAKLAALKEQLAANRKDG